MSQSEWVIASSWGANGEFLSLSRTNLKTGGQVTAPSGLQPISTYLGILISRGIAGDGGDEAEYLLMRHQPTNVPVGGVFHPSDGYARVVRLDGGLRLTARGRYAHIHGGQHGQPIVRDVPDPPPGYSPAQAWQLTALRYPWIGEFAPAAF